MNQPIRVIGKTSKSIVEENQYRKPYQNSVTRIHAYSFHNLIELFFKLRRALSMNFLKWIVGIKIKNSLQLLCYTTDLLFTICKTSLCYKLQGNVFISVVFAMKVCMKDGTNVEQSWKWNNEKSVIGRIAKAFLYKHKIQKTSFYHSNDDVCSNKTAPQLHS
jgi:hypothetical protein